MKNNKTDATNVLKFFREAKEARQGGQNNLDMMSYGGINDPTKKVGVNGEILAGPDASINSVGKPAGSHKTQIVNAASKPEEKYTYNGRGGVHKNY